MPMHMLLCFSNVAIVGYQTKTIVDDCPRGYFTLIYTSTREHFRLVNFLAFEFW